MENKKLQKVSVAALIISIFPLATFLGTCQLIYISPDLEETVLAENGNGSIKVQLEAGANYIGMGMRVLSRLPWNRGEHFIL